MLLDEWTYRCYISKYLSLKSLLDMHRVSLFLLHYVFPMWVRHHKASLQYRQLSWRSLSREIKMRACFSVRLPSWWLDRGRIGASESTDMPEKKWKNLSGHTAPTHLQVEPWTYSPRPQLYAASFHQFLKEWHWLTSSKWWRAAGIKSFPSP